MKCFHEINYTVYNSSVRSVLETNTNRTISTLAMGDLHYSNLVSQEKLDSIVKYSIDKRPNYIFLGGDLIESLNEVATEKDMLILIKFIIDLGKVAPVLISLGSHDLWRQKNNPQPNEENGCFEYQNEFLNILRNLKDKNIYLLDNESYDDGELFVTGYTQSFKYYYPNGAHIKTRDNPIIENKEAMVCELTQLLDNTTIPSNEIPIILIHALSAYGFTEEVQKLLARYFLAYGFHSHYGLIPPILDEMSFWTTRGLMSPERVIFPQNTRRTLRKSGDKIIIGGPLTMFAKNSNYDYLNKYYPMHTIITNITSDESYDTRRVHTKCYYIKAEK